MGKTQRFKKRKKYPKNLIRFINTQIAPIALVIGSFRQMEKEVEFL
jgi:hypothetical protein